MKKEGKFILKKKTSFEDMRLQEIVELPESDLCFQDSTNIYQYKFQSASEDDDKVEIEPGIFLFIETASGLKLEPMEFKKRFLLETVTSTASIMCEANTFFSRLHIYERRKKPKRRGVLVYSNPGMGKTSAIEKVCADLIAEDKGTVVFVWPTSKIDADAISKFLSVSSVYTPECTRLVLIIEDIGGGESERHRSTSGVDSGLLNLLDGVGVVFRLPTFIVATTNHPESLLSSLADRPGRFDLVLKLSPPSINERLQLMQFISGRDLTEEEKEALSGKGTEDFSIAHLEEIDVRAELHDKTYAQVIKELIQHKELFKRDFEDKDKRMGFGFGD